MAPERGCAQLSALSINIRRLLADDDIETASNIANKQVLFSTFNDNRFSFRLFDQNDFGIVPTAFDGVF